MSEGRTDHELGIIHDEDIAAFDSMEQAIEENPNRTAWEEIGAFIGGGRHPEIPDAYDPNDERNYLPEDFQDSDGPSDEEIIEYLNTEGEGDELDEEDLPEGVQQCDGCGAFAHEEDMSAGTYGPLCGDCSEDDDYEHDSSEHYDNGGY